MRPLIKRAQTERAFPLYTHTHTHAHTGARRQHMSLPKRRESRARWDQLATLCRGEPSRVAGQAQAPPNGSDSASPQGRVWPGLNHHELQRTHTRTDTLRHADQSHCGLEYNGKRDNASRLAACDADAELRERASVAQLQRAIAE